ncbi:MAG: glycoside hydrolase family 38 N-terminal domain-containing protein, partial [Limisphaerales bacterium]
MKQIQLSRQLFCAVVLLFTTPLLTFAHTLPISYLTVVPDSDHVHVELSINPFELNFLPGRAWEDATVLMQQKDTITKEILAHLEIRVGGKTVESDSVGTMMDEGSHHLTFLAHYPAQRSQPITINSDLTTVTSVSHITEVTYRGTSGEQMARLDAQNRHVEFSPTPSIAVTSTPVMPTTVTKPNTPGVLLICFAIVLVCLAVLKPRKQAIVAASVAMLFATSFAQGQTKPLWTMGQTDDMSMEFAPGSRDQASYDVEKGVLSRDFPGNQNAGRPYVITFETKTSPGETYDLVIDFVFHSASPNEMQIELNGRRGIFPIRQSAAGHAKTKREENEMLLTRGRLTASLRPEWFQEKNKLTLTPMGIGNLSYDSLTLQRRANAEPSETLRLEPTIFYVKTNGTMRERCDLLIPFDERFSSGKATVEISGKRFSHQFTNANYDFGVLSETFEIPTTLKPGEANIELMLDGSVRSAACAFKPAKQWKVYICPKVHNDVGYTDLQPHVNELDNRNTDTVLDVLATHPEYKFNFETSWLVDNYLNCRSLDYCKRFYYEAAHKRATVNALYLNLMTGICSGEELYRAVYFTHRLHREHGANFDFACLTDAPSHSWFLPTLLKDVGVKAFSNGSNQTRAPILHYSDLNENSPYYWQGMNGEKIMMWYAISYRQLSRLIGSDGGPAVGVRTMEATVPQFLTRFQRDDYNPDAVMIYGAYVDNAAIPKNADAPVIEEWNKRYEFPKLVVGSDGDYFNYIEKNFSDKLRTYRGDCGAYWEDGAASSAKATTLNRQSQRILPTAETAAALASIFQARNRYPAEEFESAWKNVMFYDEHTWGAHNSIGQPDREFVTRQWEIKESYATRANLDARNLLARGFNRFVQNIAAENNCVVAFNFQPSTRTAPLEVELDHNQTLIDPATGKPAPMDIIGGKDGWKRVRFLAKDVPAFGYKCFPVKGGSSENKKSDGDTIENRFYKLMIDTTTGGIKSLFDKTEQRELADTSAPYKLNETLYASGGEDT